MKLVLTLMIAFLGLTTSFSQVKFVKQDISKAKAKAKEGQKYIMVDVYADWCGWCKKMDVTTFKDDDVSDFINENMVALKINTDKSGGREFASKYGVKSLPTIVYLDYEGNLVRVAKGYKTAKQLLPELEPYKLKRKSVVTSGEELKTYFTERKEYEEKLMSSLSSEELNNKSYVNAYELGMENDVFKFDKSKFEFSKTASTKDVILLDVFFFLGKKEYQKALDKIEKTDLSSSLSVKQSEFIVFTLVRNSFLSQELLVMINEASTKTKDASLLETKALVQFLLGDIEDAKDTINKVKKLNKKAKSSLSLSAGRLEKMLKKGA